MQAQARALRELPFALEAPQGDPVLVGIVAAAEKGPQRERGFREDAFERLPGAVALLERERACIGIGGFGVALRPLPRAPELGPRFRVLRLPRCPLLVVLHQLIGASRIAQDPAQAHVDVRFGRRFAAGETVLLYRFVDLAGLRQRIAQGHCAPGILRLEFHVAPQERNGFRRRRKARQLIDSAGVVGVGREYGSVQALRELAISR